MLNPVVDVAQVLQFKNNKIMVDRQFIWLYN